MSSPILYQNSESTVFLIDIPRSIEVAQGDPGSSSKLLSSEPLEHPYLSLEPKSTKARAKLAPSSLEDLLLHKHLEFALAEVQLGYTGAWCLPRVTEQDPDDKIRALKRKRAAVASSADGLDDGRQSARDAVGLDTVPSQTFMCKTRRARRVSVTNDEKKHHVWIPPKSTVLSGEIQDTLGTFSKHAPCFDLIVLDPPWPNRSARRKKDYSISYDNTEIRQLLFYLPLYDHLTASGMIAIWITNKDAFREMVIGPGGVFEQWGVTLVEEWIWLKTTVHGEPICELDGVWRKPYEVLLVGRRTPRNVEGVKRRVLVGVPDLHSRKPNLEVLFGIVRKEDRNADEGSDTANFAGLEVFARNLTAGWWGWGNEVLQFQSEEHWKEEHPI